MDEKFSEINEQLNKTKERVSILETRLDEICNAITARRFATQKESSIMEFVFLPLGHKCSRPPYRIRTFQDLQVFLELVGRYSRLAEEGHLQTTKSSFESTSDNRMSRGMVYIRQINSVCLGKEAVLAFLELADKVQTEVRQRMDALLEWHPDLVDWISDADNFVVYTAFTTVERMITYFESRDEPELLASLLGLQSLDLDSIAKDLPIADVES